MATEQAVNDLKIKRRTVKAKLTRLSNCLTNLLDGQGDFDEVTQMLQDLSLAYKDLEAKHEQYCETIADDEEFMKEDSWLEDCQTTFLSMRKKVKDYGKMNTRNSDSHSNATPERNNDRAERASSCKVQIERPKLPQFSGDVRDYTTFKSDFKHLIEFRYEKRDAITILRTSITGKPLDLIRGLGNDYEATWAHLDNIYGDPRLVAHAIVYDLGKFHPLKEGEDGRRSYNTLQEVGKTNDMDNNHMISLIEKKMSNEDRKLWLRFVERERTDAPFHALLYWMEMELKTRIRASAPVRDGRSSAQQRDRRSSASVSNVVEDDKAKKKPDFRCWLCKSSEHWVDQCKKVLEKSQQERFQLLKENRACFSCLKRAGKDHNMKTCKRRKRCTAMINGEQCSAFHHPLLQREMQPRTDIVSSVTGNSGLLPVLTVKLVSSNGQMKLVNCLLDSGAQVSLIKNSVAEDQKLRSKCTTINLTKVGCVTEQIRTKLYRIKIQSLDDHRIFAVDAIGLDCINEDITEVNVGDLAERFNIRKELLHRNSGCAIDLLVGVDHAKMHTGETRQSGKLVARHSPLGWVIFGATNDQATMSTVLNVVLSNPIDLREFWTTESMGVCYSPDNCQLSGLSRQEADECKLISDSCKKVGNQWLVPYPWCKDPNQLPDNRSKAEKMLYATERKLAKNPQHAEAYDNQIKEMVENNCAQKLSEDESRTYAGPVHYVSHHAVIRPDKKSTPVRIVLNSSASYQGHSLNDYWMKGPNFLNRLFGVLLRFRQHEVALCADISKMYHRVMIPEEDQQVHRFLWRNLDQDRKPDVYVMKVVTFGDKPSPAMAQMALRKTAEEGADKYPEAASAIKKDTYMDDICVSVPTVAEAEKLSSDIDKVLADGGFKVKGWRSNKALSRYLDETEGKPRLLEAISDDKVLGVVWENDTDIFSYKVKMSENAIHLTMITKRGILSQVARVFNPIGFTTAFVIRAKIGLQKMWEQGLDWDDVLPKESQAEWRRLFEEMEKLSNIRFERCITPAGAIGRPTLCIFCDASLDAFGAVAYLRWEVKGGRYDVRFLTAKSRVTPLKQLTVPRLELQGAVLASRLYTAIMNEMTLNLDEVIFMTDSLITLSWIKSRARSFKMFVATRVGEIQGSTNPSHWRHIPGDVDVADDLTRGLNADQLNDRWHRGPDFLRKPKSEWPEEAKVEKKSESEQERRKEQSVMVVTEPAEDIIDYLKIV
nr:uncharacterized protein LOC129267449 [Lytechinus pictus]